MLWTQQKEENAKTTLYEKENGINVEIMNNRSKFWEYRNSPPVEWSTPGINLIKDKQTK